MQALRYTEAMRPFTWQAFLYLAVMVSVIVGADLLFFKHEALLRLFANIAIVAVFLVAYLLIFKPFK